MAGDDDDEPLKALLAPKFTGVTLAHTFKGGKRERGTRSAEGEDGKKEP